MVGDVDRRRATRAAPLVASDSVGCGAMPSATVSMVAPASIATTPDSTMSVTCGPTITSPSKPAVLFLHRGTRIRDPRKCPSRNVIAILLPRLNFGQADAGDLRVSEDRPRNGAVTEGGDVPARVLCRHFSLTESGVRQLPVPGTVAHGVDVRHDRAPLHVGGDAQSAVELDADFFQADPPDQLSAAHGDKHQVRLDGLAIAEMDSELRSGVFDFRTLTPEMQRELRGRCSP